MIQADKKLFTLGQIVATPAAIEVLENVNIAPTTLINRHVIGDFGECCDEDWQTNVEAIENGERVFSIYKVGDEAIWIITEADRSSTCVLTPEDY